MLEGDLLLRVRGVGALINTNVTGKALAHAIRVSAARRILVGSEHAEKLQAVLPQLETQGEGDGQSHLLVLEPKKKRISKRVTQVRFWLDPERYLPTRVEYLGKSGNTRVVEFHEIQVNPDLATTLYTVDLPADVKVTKGFGGFLGLSSEDYDSTEN